jgi:hypothetical protein
MATVKSSPSKTASTVGDGAKLSKQAAKKSPEKKGIDEQISALEKRLAKLKEKKANNVLDAASPGMEKLLASLNDVCSQNGCNVIDVLKAISRLKKLGLKMDRPPRKPRTPKAKKAAADTGTT